MPDTQQVEATAEAVLEATGLDTEAAEEAMDVASASEELAGEMFEALGRIERANAAVTHTAEQQKSAKDTLKLAQEELYGLVRDARDRQRRLFAGPAEMSEAEERGFNDDLEN